MVYKWKEGARFRVSAQTAGEALDAIRAKHDGYLEPAVVVKESKRKSAPLHPCFEWDDERASQLYREEQARLLIRSVRVVETPDSKPARAYVNVTVPDVGSRYMSMSVAMSDVTLRRQVLEEAMALLAGVRERLAELQKVQRLTDALDALENEIKKEIKRETSGKKRTVATPGSRKKKMRAQPGAALQSKLSA